MRLVSLFAALCLASTIHAATPDGSARMATQTVIVGDSGVLVVDTTFLPSRVEADIALIRSVAGQAGAICREYALAWQSRARQRCVRTFPGASIVGPRESGDFIDLNLNRAPRSMTAANSSRRRALAEFEAQLTAGKDTAGKVLSEAEKKSLAENIARRRAELFDLARVEVAAPDVLFADELTLRLGKRRIEIRNRARANTRVADHIRLGKAAIRFRRP